MSQRAHISPDGRRRLREAALRNQPWTRSTGPKTIEGQQRSSQNSLKHGLWRFLRDSASYRVDLAKWLADLDLDDARHQVQQALRQSQNPQH